MITGAQRDAGERLANDFTLAGMMPRVTANWSAIAPDRNTRRAAPGAGVEISERAADAQRRVQTALLTVGVEFAGLLIDVCCLETGLEVLEVRERWPQRSAKLLLQVALTRLARHYGIIPPPREPLARLRHWAAGDFQPNLAAWREPAPD